MVVGILSFKMKSAAIISLLNIDRLRWPGVDDTGTDLKSFVVKPLIRKINGSAAFGRFYQ